MQYTGPHSVTQRVLASSDREARQACLNNLPGSHLLWQRRTSLNLKTKNKSRSQRCHNLPSPGNTRPAWPRAELLNLALRIKHSSIPTPTGFMSRCIQHRDGCARRREGGRTSAPQQGSGCGMLPAAPPHRHPRGLLQQHARARPPPVLSSSNTQLFRDGHSPGFGGKLDPWKGVVGRVAHLLLFLSIN